LRSRVGKVNESENAMEKRLILKLWVDETNQKLTWSVTHEGGLNIIEGIGLARTYMAKAITQLCTGQNEPNEPDEPKPGQRRKRKKN
jgi:hypothetical protein